VVFLDPPFDQGVPDKVLSLLAPLLATGGLVYMEAGAKAVLPQSWKTEKQGKAGQVHFQLMRWEP
jgi:16S rRNA (guanine966-N2)-methyltransferase